MKNIKLLICLFLLSCSQVSTLNMNDFQFGRQPNKIFWFHFDGLSDEHLTFLKSQFSPSSQKIVFENFDCYGKAWEYNLYNLRPKTDEAFLTHMTGTDDIKSTCSDYKQKPFWSFLSSSNYSVAIIENSKSKVLSGANKCEKSFLQDAYYFKTGDATPEGQKKYQLESKFNYKKGEVYFDDSCQSYGCTHSKIDNFNILFRGFSRNLKNFAFIYRDSSLLDNLKAKKMNLYKDSLNEIVKIIESAQQYLKSNRDALLLVTSSSPMAISFPLKGKRWQKFNETGDGLDIRNSDLLSSVFASGARAENFCGIYKQSDIVSRLFTGSNKRKLQLNFYNPFKAK